MKTLKITVSVSFDWPTYHSINELCRRDQNYWIGRLVEELMDETASFEGVNIEPKYADEDKQKDLL